MIKWIKRVLYKTKQRKNPITPFTLSNQELTKIFREQQVCPDCGVWDFREGPSGGMSTNIYCANCGSWFNDQGPFGLDRLFKGDNLDLNQIDLDHSDMCELDHSGTYELYTWDILKNWHKVVFDDDNIHERLISLLDAANWCTSNKISEWSIKDYTLYFKNESDAVAVKLRWA